MPKKPPVVKTNRLIITPMSDDEMNRIILETEDEGLKSAYEEMLSGAQNDPDNRNFYIAWKISLKSSGETVGSACFKGPQKNSAAEIGYGIDEKFRNNGYATEAIRSLSDWAFTDEKVYFLEAETEENNEASKKVLEKLEFEPDGNGEEGPRFVLERPKTSWMSIFMCLGISVGVSLGSAFGNMSLGTCFGLAIGMLIGLLIDNEQKKKMEKLRLERKKPSENTNENQ